ncbi:hypothetical protein [Fluviicola sp.]|uniref:hypothetical protein n=1 Tax=Fluviicola sp. TaxID=1917219 RepID=UPI0031DE10F4
MNPLHDSTEHFRIGIPEADKRIYRWQNDNFILVSKTFEGPVPSGYQALPLDSFSLSVEDLLHLTERIKTYNLNESGKDNFPITGFSCRLGIKDYANKLGEPEPLPCLMMEPIIGFERNEDPHNPIASNPGELLECIPEDIGGKIFDYSAIYDFSYPCPPTCPKKTNK